MPFKVSKKIEKQSRSEQNHCFQEVVISWDTKSELGVPKRTLVSLPRCANLLRLTGLHVDVDFSEFNRSYFPRCLKTEVIVN